MKNHWLLKRQRVVKLYNERVTINRDVLTYWFYPKAYAQSLDWHFQMTTFVRGYGVFDGTGELLYKCTFTNEAIFTAGDRLTLALPY